MLSILLFIIDYLLWPNESYWKNLLGNEDFRVIYVIPLYLAMSYAIKTYPKTLREAFILGFLCYSFFDLTFLALFKKYSLTMAVLDMTWGGFLFMIGKFILNFLK